MRSSLLLIICLVVIASSQVVNIFPNSSYSQVTASSRACFANCQFCQIKTGFCEECLSPYFQKDANGNCVLINGYIIESSQQEIAGGTGFTPSNISWSNTKTTTCSPDSTYFQAGLKVLGPFGAGNGTVTYQRSVSSHKYMKLKLFLLKINWSQADSLEIIVKNQNNVVLSNLTLTATPNVPKESLCSSTPQDQRFSISIDYENIGTTAVFISFSPKFSSPSPAFAISTFLLLTGRCHETCDDCDGSILATKCKSCKNFFIQGADGTCSQCADGFRKVVMGGVPKCQKCPIEYKSCETNNEACFYSYLPAQLDPNTCRFNTKKNFISQYYHNTDEFAASLFTINGASSIYKCGDYSLIGLAGKAESITRFFTTLRVHQALSMTFNIMIVDQTKAQKSLFQIYIDNVRVQNLFINTVGVSSICGGPEKQVFQTYPATKFFIHNSTQNVNITIRSSNTANWGIRNFRLSFHVCDDSCLECGPNGCTTCNGFYGLDMLTCSACPKGASPADFDSGFCYECPQNCLSCNITKVNNETQRICTQCQQGFFVFEGNCEILPNVGQTIKQDNKEWTSTNPLLGDNQCGVDFKSNLTTNPRKISFLVAENTLSNTYNISQPHYKMLISFYLLKIDNWTSTDQLHLYLNDLLVMKKTYGEFGNRICYTQNQNDLVTYQEIQYEDSNETLTAYFEVVSTNGTKRKFGISNFIVNPVACKQCLSYDFQYKVQYNYDQVLTVQVIFNRLYVNNDPDLFKKIFILEVNGQQLNYQVTRNDSIRYFLEAHPDAEVLLSNITVFCKYPDKVTTDIFDPINTDKFFESRLMQETTTGRLKSLSNSVSSAIIERFTPLDSPDSSNGVRIFFEVVTRIVVYVGFFSFFIGCLTPCTHFMHNVQKIWLHIYVASLTMPNFLKFALKGFRESQDQNIAINPTQWQVGIPKHLYYNAPAQYQDYYHDITFFRNIYNVGFAAALYLVFAIVVYLIFTLKKAGRESNNKFIQHMKITFYRRPFFVFNSVIFYQYVTICIACTLQFIDLSSKTNQNPFKTLNAVATVICFVLATAYPLFHFFYLSYKQNDMYSIDYEISYRNRYHEIFYRFLPKNLWKIPNFQFVPIGFRQRFYNLLRFGEIWWFSIIFALMYGSPFAQAFLLLVSNFLHLAFLWISSISSTRTFKILKVLELMFFVGLQIIILVAFQQNQTLTKDAYKALGIVGVAFIFVILGLSFIRFIYTFMRLVNEYRQCDTKEHRKDERLRNDDFFASFQNNNQRIISEND